jgi:hypothetical protein
LKVCEQKKWEARAGFPKGTSGGTTKNERECAALKLIKRGPLQKPDIALKNAQFSGDKVENELFLRRRY